jgi:hypothetical protein
MGGTGVRVGGAKDPRKRSGSTKKEGGESPDGKRGQHGRDLSSRESM